MKAQLTIYIVLGLIAILFAGIGISMLYKSIAQTKISPQQTAISEYITDCLQSDVKEAIKIIGKQGGHLELKGVNRGAAEGDVLMIAEQPIPYWWYLKSENTCTSCDLTSAQIPTKELVAHQIQSYVEKNLKQCASFDEFAQQGMHVIAGNITARVDFAKEDTRIFLNWPVTIIQAETETRIGEFETSVDVPFSRMYDLAREIVDVEKNNSTFENMLLHIIGLYSDTTPDKLPPFSATTHESAVISWNEKIVEQYLAGVLTSTVPIIHYGRQTPTRTFEESVLSSLTFGRDADFEVRVHYLGWPFYFDITPDSKGILSPDVVRTKFPNNVAPPFQTNTYEFFYDVSLPLLVEIRDKEAIKGEGFSFFFAVEANIRDNKALKDFFTGEGTYGPFDAVINTTKLQKIVNKTLFCDEEQKAGGTVKINIADGRNNTPVPNAALSYGCGKISNCALSATNSHGTLKTKLPVCYNGHIRVEKQGYSPAVQLYTAEFEKTEEVNITLQPLREVQISVKKFATNGTALVGGPRSLSTQEQAIIILNRITERIEEPFQAQTTVVGTETAQLKIIPGMYEVRIMLVDKKGFVLPAKCMQICEAYDKEGKCSAFKQLPEKKQDVKPAILGGLVLNSNTELFEITDYTLDKRGVNAMEFYVIRTQTPNCIAKENCVLPNCIGIDEIGRTEEYSKRFIEELKPRFLSR